MLILNLQFNIAFVQGKMLVKLHFKWNKKRHHTPHQTKKMSLFGVSVRIRISNNESFIGTNEGKVIFLWIISQLQYPSNKLKYDFFISYSLALNRNSPTNLNQLYSVYPIILLARISVSYVSTFYVYWIVPLWESCERRIKKQQYRTVHYKTDEYHQP